MSVSTLVVPASLIFLSRHELVKAWNLFLHAVAAHEKRTKTRCA